LLELRCLTVELEVGNDVLHPYEDGIVGKEDAKFLGDTNTDSVSWFLCRYVQPEREHSMGSLFQISSLCLELAVRIQVPAKSYIYTFENCMFTLLNKPLKILNIYITNTRLLFQSESCLVWLFVIYLCFGNEHDHFLCLFMLSFLRPT
jgi:hypothetical protein